jgi:hypothetical protein
MADIIRDSSGARQKFGFGGEPGSAISSAPKLTNQWFLEFKTTDGKNAEEYSAYAKSVSPITIQTQTQPIDKYGRRIYVPTRVEFPEVSVSLYDKVDGSTMSFAQKLYKRYFKNQDMNVDTGLANELNSTTNSGRKIVDADYAFRSFSSVTIYHWFGDQKNGGHAQRIVLVNPVITSITFSNSDYAVSEARVIDITLQPENVVFGAMETEAAIPNWMNLGISSEQQATSLATDPLAGVDDTKQQGADLYTLPSSIGTQDPDVRPAQPVTQEQSESYTTIGGEKYIPNQPMTENQVAATEARIAMGNEVSGQELKDYNTGKARRDARIEEDKRLLDSDPRTLGAADQERRKKAAQQRRINEINKNKYPDF